MDSTASSKVTCVRGKKKALKMVGDVNRWYSHFPLEHIVVINIVITFVSNHILYVRWHAYGRQTDFPIAI